MSQEKFTPEQKWDFYMGSSLMQVLAPKGFNENNKHNNPTVNVLHYTQSMVIDAIKTAIYVHRQYQVDLRAAIQLMIAQERAKIILNPERFIRIKCFEEIIQLIDTLAPTNVKEEQEQRPELIIPANAEMKVVKD